MTNGNPEGGSLLAPTLPAQSTGSDNFGLLPGFIWQYRLRVPFDHSPYGALERYSLRTLGGNVIGELSRQGVLDIGTPENASWRRMKEIASALDQQSYNHVYGGVLVRENGRPFSQSVLQDLPGLDVKAQSGQLAPHKTLQTQAFIAVVTDPSFDHSMHSGGAYKLLKDRGPGFNVNGKMGHISEETAVKADGQQQKFIVVDYEAAQSPSEKGKPKPVDRVVVVLAHNDGDAAKALSELKDAAEIRRNQGAEDRAQVRERKVWEVHLGRNHWFGRIDRWHRVPRTDVIVPNADRTVRYRVIHGQSGDRTYSHVRDAKRRVGGWNPAQLTPDEQRAAQAVLLNIYVRKQLLVKPPQETVAFEGTYEQSGRWWVGQRGEDGSQYRLSNNGDGTYTRELVDSKGKRVGEVEILRGTLSAEAQPLRDAGVEFLGGIPLFNRLRSKYHKVSVAIPKSNHIEYPVK